MKRSRPGGEPPICAPAGMVTNKQTGRRMRAALDTAEHCAAPAEGIEGAGLTKYVIRGGKPLHGEIEISGAKNAAVAIIPAALLVDGVCRIENIPQISDVTLILTILQELGADVRTVNRTTVDVDCSHIRNGKVPHELARKIRDRKSVV